LTEIRKFLRSPVNRLLTHPGSSCGKLLCCREDVR